MPTECLATVPASLFLFAHQDNEFAIFQQIDASMRSGQSVYCAYATDGAATADAVVRNLESLSVLRAMGVPKSNVFFFGGELDVRDGRLHEKAADVALWLDDFLDAHSEIATCYVPAWEGGHPDHDLLHAIAVHAMQLRGRVDDVRQFPLYHGHNCSAPFFSIQTPLRKNGAVELHQILWRDRLRYLRYCLSYRSQWRTWVALFPVVCLRNLFGGVQCLQRVDPMRLVEPPHAGRLYYEGRGFFTWQEMKVVLGTLQSGGNENIAK